MPMNYASALIAFVLTLASLYVYKKLDYFITYFFHKSTMLLASLTTTEMFSLTRSLMVKR